MVKLQFSIDIKNVFHQSNNIYCFLAQQTSPSIWCCSSAPSQILTFALFNRWAPTERTAAAWADSGPDTPWRLRCRCLSSPSSRPPRRTWTSRTRTAVGPAPSVETCRLVTLSSQIGHMMDFIFMTNMTESNTQQEQNVCFFSTFFLQNLILNNKTLLWNSRLA